jgi:hypothetical protein
MSQVQVQSPLYVAGPEAAGVQRADQGADTGSGNDVGVDAMLFEDLHHTDVGQTPRATAAQGITYLGAI